MYACDADWFKDGALYLIETSYVNTHKKHIFSAFDIYSNSCSRYPSRQCDTCASLHAVNTYCYEFYIPSRRKGTMGDLFKMQTVSTTILNITSFFCSTKFKIWQYWDSLRKTFFYRSLFEWFFLEFLHNLGTKMAIINLYYKMSVRRNESPSWVQQLELKSKTLMSKLILRTLYDKNQIFL